MILNAENMVFGRIASYAAQHAMDGENVVVVNAEKSIITGRKNFILKKFRTRVNLTVKGNPEKGAMKYSRMPDRILRRAIRGMLPFKSARGRSAFKKVNVFIGTPEEFKKQEFFVPKGFQAKKRRNYVLLEEICKELGAKW